MDATTVAGWAVELSKIEDEISAQLAELKEEAVERRKQIKFLRERSKKLLALISGREHERLPLPEPKLPTPAGTRWVGLDKRGYHLVNASADLKSKTKCGEPLKVKGREPSITWLAPGQVPADRDQVCIDCAAYHSPQASK